jgi:hypothetical protein
MRGGLWVQKILVNINNTEISPNNERVTTLYTVGPSLHSAAGKILKV